MGTTELISLQLRMFLIMLIGLSFRKREIISEKGKKDLTDLVIYLILPCNIVKSFQVSFTEETLKNFGTILLISICIPLTIKAKKACLRNCGEHALVFYCILYKKMWHL